MSPDINRLLEPLGELPRDPSGQRVREHEHVLVPLIVSAHVGTPVLIEPSYDFCRRQVQILLEHALQILCRPKDGDVVPIWIRPTQEGCDLFAVGGPFRLDGSQSASVAGLCCGDDLGSDQTSLSLPQREVRLDRPANSVLILEQAFRDLIRVLRLASELGTSLDSPAEP